ncbi:hypothetical protein Q3G72_016944 [Acer saccharum]|nr:hypothetical protein Q3G72_016944 [Acer saccharum]
MKVWIETRVQKQLSLRLNKATEEPRQSWEATAGQKQLKPELALQIVANITRDADRLAKLPGKVIPTQQRLLGKIRSDLIRAFLTKKNRGDATTSIRPVMSQIMFPLLELTQTP